MAGLRRLLHFDARKYLTNLKLKYFRRGIVEEHTHDVSSGRLFGAQFKNAHKEDFIDIVILLNRRDTSVQ